MVKFKNRVAQTKVSRFIETSPLVIFLNGKYSESDQKKIKIDLQKKFSKSVVISGKESKQLHLANTHQYKITLHKNIVSNYSERDIINTRFSPEVIPPVIQIKFVKNKYVKKILSEKPLFNCLALPQANNLVIALQATTFFLLKDLKQDNQLSNFGAIYKNCSIDHNQISLLSKVIEEDEIYYNLNNILKKNCNSLTTLINLPILTQCAYTLIFKNVYAKLLFTIACLQKK